MEYSNAFGALLLTTGNKSEISVGYCTLYGDTNGGLGLIGDLYKTEVFALSRHINASAGRELIPVAVLDKPPSAELAPGQRDTDSLPPYPVLDEILKWHIEGQRLPEAESAQALTPGRPAARDGRRARPGAAHPRHGRPQRIQAAPGGAHHPRAFARLWQRAPIADRRPLPYRRRRMTLAYSADAAILIGRFQPFHNGHAGLLQTALATAAAGGGGARLRLPCAQSEEPVHVAGTGRHDRRHPARGAARARALRGRARLLRRWPVGRRRAARRGGRRARGCSA